MNPWSYLYNSYLLKGSGNAYQWNQLLDQSYYISENIRFSYGVKGVTLKMRRIGIPEHLNFEGLDQHGFMCKALTYEDGKIYVIDNDERRYRAVNLHYQGEEGKFTMQLDIYTALCDFHASNDKLAQLMKRLY